MKVLVQRVSNAKVTTTENGKVAGEIDKGLLLLVGIGEEDNKEKVIEMAKNVSKLRVMADKKGKMNHSVKDVSAGLLVVSQFTLYADTSKGNRPSFIKAAGPKKAEKLYELFVEELKKRVDKVETGSFGDYMEIETSLDGPVTILLE